MPSAESWASPRVAASALSPAPSQPPSEKSVTHVWSSSPAELGRREEFIWGRRGASPHQTHPSPSPWLHTGCLPFPAQERGWELATHTPAPSAAGPRWQVKSWSWIWKGGSAAWPSEGPSAWHQVPDQGGKRDRWVCGKGWGGRPGNWEALGSRWELVHMSIAVGSL